MDKRTKIVIVLLALAGGFYALSIFKNRLLEDKQKPVEAQSLDARTEQVVLEEINLAKGNDTTEPVNQSWLSYTSDKGFSISYPYDWKLSMNSGDSAIPSVISLRSPETELLLKNNRTPYTQDINIYYYHAVADESENMANNLGATTLEEMINRNTMITKIGLTEIGGMSGVDVIWGGNGAYYTILVTRSSQLYKIQFSRFSEKKDMNDTEKSIIKSFKLVD